MATFNNGINGGFTGKAGSVIAYQLHGKWVMKGMPKPSAKNKRGTTSQKACRCAFTKMQTFLSPLIDFIRVGFNLESKSRQMTAHNAAKSYNMLNAMNEDGTIQYDQVCLTQGSLTGVAGAKVEKDDVGFHFSWNDNSNYSGSRKANDAAGSDQVMLVAYDVKGKHATFITSGARRSTGKETLLMQNFEKGKEMHLWISFIADDRDHTATSSYLGAMVY